MRFIFFDTETNGLPLQRHAAFSDVKNWPQIVQIAWQIWEYTGSPTCVKRVNYIVKPSDDIVWDKESAAIHGISHERACAEGVPGSVCFAQFVVDASGCDMIVAHNLAFDKPVVLCELHRLAIGIPPNWWPSLEYCTMEKTRYVCKLPNKIVKPSNPYKYPRLGELYSFLFGKAPDARLHSADQDVDVLVCCFNELLNRRVVTLESLRILRVADDSTV